MNRLFVGFYIHWKNERVITSIGVGVYVLEDISSSSGKSKFVPTLSPEIERINSIIQKSFPYINYLIWDTKILHEFMTHQPGQSQIILEAEKDVREIRFQPTLKSSFWEKFSWTRIGNRLSDIFWIIPRASSSIG